MQPKGDHLRILLVLRRAMAQRDVRAMCKKNKLGSTTLYQGTKPDAGNPSLAVLCRIVNALGYELVARRRRGVEPLVPLPPEARADIERVVAAAERRS